MTPVTKYVLVIVTVIICSSNIISIFGEVSEDGKLFADTLQLMKEKNFQSSLIKIRQFLSTNPDNFEAKTNECAILLELKQISEAESCLEVNLTKKPDDLTNSLNLGMLYTVQENYEAAKTQFSLVHQRDPNDETAYANLLAVRLLIGDDVDQIIQEHKELLEKNEFNVQILANLGKILNDKREFEKAKYFLDRAYEIDNKHVNVLEQLGVWYALQGDLQNADAFFSSALKESPNNISVLNNLGLLHRELGDKFGTVSEYYKSIGYYDSVLHIEPDNVYANVGQTYSAQKIQEIYQHVYFFIYLIAIISFGIGIFTTWMYTQDIKKSEKSLKSKTDDNEIEKTLKKILKIKVLRIFLIGSLLTAASIILLHLAFNVPLNSGSDMSNLASTIIEIGIGVMISMIILTYELSKQDRFNEDQRQIRTLIESTQTMTSENKQLIEKVTETEKTQDEVLKSIQNRDFQQEKYIYKYLENHLTKMLQAVKDLETEIFQWTQAGNPRTPLFLNKIEDICREIYQYNLDLTSDGLFANPYFFTEIKSKLQLIKPMLEKWPIFNPPNNEFILIVQTKILPIINNTLQTLQTNHKSKYSI